ncbi:hypothetical protein SAMD00019534_043680, partial [Acytostelium subglobosum LB1]|uniref:hypothetical protein n=1 Tax=Acytostelium subglobosum LB1 TaxID=1410327 RepID=UPI000644CA86
NNKMNKRKNKEEVQRPPPKKIEIEEEEEDIEDIEDDQVYEDDVEQDDDVNEDDEEDDDGVDEDEDGDEDGDEVDDQGTGLKKKKKKNYVIKPMSQDKILDLQAKNQQKGVIYLSTIPAKMTAAKLKNLLLKHGSVTRMKLLKANVERKAKRNDMFKEGWIEFSDKKEARRIALILNNQPMGGKQKDIHRDCLWNIRYLPKFKWYHLMDKLVQKKLERDKRIHMELDRVRKENSSFLNQLEHSKTVDHINTRSKNKNKVVDDDKVVRTFKQRTVHDQSTSDKPNKKVRR